MLGTLAVAVAVLAAACEDKATIHAAETRSPDGRWIAATHTDQYGGPGTAAIITSVALRRTTGRTEPIEVLALNQNATDVGLTVTWPTASRLDITYHAPAEVDFQAIRAAGITISVRELAAPATPTRAAGARDARTP